MKIQELVEKILEANKAYRSGDEIMSDAEYDKMLDILKKFAPAKYSFLRSLLLDGTPTGESVDLPVVVGSLEKLKNGHDEDIAKWVSSQGCDEFVLTSKVDGLSLLLCYYDGELRLISTRGDGSKGEVKTNKLKGIVPEKLTGGLSKGFVIIRGEGVMTDDNFKTLNKLGYSYKAKRNAAVGLVNSKDTKKTIEHCSRFLEFIGYQIYRSNIQFKTYDDVLIELQSQGFKTPQKTIVNGKSLNSAELMKIYNLHIANEPFDIDGIVIQNNIQFNECDKKLPEHSIAFKANQLNSVTTITGFEWEVSKDGSLRPIAHVNPLELNGAIITKASAFNSDWIKENKVGVGAVVELQMQGDIIPGINSVIETSEQYDFPKHCPCCGSIVKEKGKFLYCVNPACKCRAVKSIAHFLRNLDVGFAGDTNLENWKIYSINDLIEFIPNGKQQEKFVKELKTKLWNISEQKLVESFDYSGVGKKIINKIIDANSLEAFIDKFFKDEPITLNKATGITDATFKRVMDGVKFNDIANSYHSIVYNDKWHKQYKNTSILAGDTSLAGKSFCFTGALTIPRKMAETLVKEKGGEVKSGVNKTLTYLVTNDIHSGSSKNKKATELGINIISEKTFFSLINYELPENMKTIASITEQIKKGKLKDSFGIDDI